MTGSSSALELTRLEWWFCGTILLACVALHFPAVYNRMGLPIEAALSLLSFATPISGMLYLSASQVIPDPPAGPFSSSQMAVLGFLVWQLGGGVGGWTRSATPFLKSVAPFFVWISAMTLLHGDGVKTTLLLAYAILTGCAAAVLAWRSQKRIMTCLVAFMAGQLLAATVFWMIKLRLGEPVQAFQTAVYGDSTAEGALRIGTARGNAGMLGTPMALIIMGAVGLLMASRSRDNRRRWLTNAIATVSFVIATAALLGSGSRGPLVSLVAGVVFFVVARLGGRNFSLGTLCAVTTAGVLFVLSWNWLGLQEYWDYMQERQATQTEESGALIAGRDLEWKAALNGVLDSPVTGGGKVTLLSYQGNEQYWASHSTYLDAGLQGGIPALALFVWFTLKPLVLLWGRRREFAVGVLLGVYFVTILSNSYGSAMQTKQFWILWGLAAACFLPAVARIKTRRNHAASRVERREQRTEGGNRMPVVRSP